MGGKKPTIPAFEALIFQKEKSSQLFTMRQKNKETVWSKRKFKEKILYTVELLESWHQKLYGHTHVKVP